MLTREGERARVRVHLEGAEALMLAHAPAGLTQVQHAHRRYVLSLLRQYIEAEQYPANEREPRTTPIFVDGRGVHCAVGYLLAHTGHNEFVEHVKDTRNLARVRALANEPELVTWLAESGITLAEAARIQPSYAASDDYDPWKLTMAIWANALGGEQAHEGLRSTLSLGARFGLNLRGHHHDDHGGSRESLLTLAAEYSYSATLDVASAHQLSALMMISKPASRHHDHGRQYWLLGPTLALSPSDRLKTGVGGQAGFGVKFGEHAIPWFAELVVQGLAQRCALTLRGGLQAGVFF